MNISFIKTLLLEVLDARCPTCDRPINTFSLCETCRLIPRLEHLYCMICQSPVSVGRTCVPCRHNPISFFQTVSSTLEINEIGRRLLHSIKYQKKFERLSLLVPFLPDHLPHLRDKNPLLIPVPLSKNRFRERTFNQSEWLAKTLAKKLNLNLDVKSLIKIKDTPAQSTLTRSERSINLAKAFIWEPTEPTPKIVCLVDDVFTTGETLRSCARALFKVGVEQVFGWTLFRKLGNVT